MGTFRATKNQSFSWIKKDSKKTLFQFFKTLDNVDSVFYQDLGKKKDFVSVLKKQILCRK